MLKRFFPLLLLIFLIWCEVANAESISDLKISYYEQSYKFSNSSTWVTIPNNYFTISGGLSLNFQYSGSVHTPSNTYTNQYPNVYGRIYLCSDQNMSAGWSPDNSASNVWFYNTNIPCNYYNSTYANGKLWIGNYTAYATWYESGVGSFEFRVNTYFDNTASVQIYSNILSLNQFEPYSYESGSYLALQEILNVLSSQNSQNSTIVNNQQQIINNQQQQTQDIINSQQEQTQAIIDSNKVCNQYDKVSSIQNGILQSNGSIDLTSNVNFGITDYIKISKTSTIEVTNPISQSFYACFYNVNKSLISCSSVNGYSGFLTIPDGSSYFRGTINLSQNKPTYTICTNGNTAINDSLNDSDTTQASSNGSSWFSGFHVDNTKGFTSIITAPIRLIQGILNGSSSCTNLTIPISLKHNSTTLSNEVSLPCGSILWNNVPNAAVLLYWSTIFGLFAWWVLRDMYKFIDSIRDPDNKTEFLMKL